MLTAAEIETFKKLVLDVYGIELTNDMAHDQGGRLIRLFELILKNRTSKKDTIEN